MPKLATWVSRVLVIFIGYLLAIIALRFVPVEQTLAAVTTDAPLEVPAVGIPTIAEIANSAARENIFGKAGVQKVVSNKPKNLPVVASKLNLTLVGLYTAQPADRALAIIKNGGKPEEVFRVGETITGRAVLVEVQRSKIVIDNGGKREFIELPEKVASTGRSTGLENLPGGNNQIAGNNGQQIQLPDSPREIRDTLVKNPAMLNKLVSAVPYRENGRILGYRLTPKQGGALLEQNGVLPGDVVTRVNGIALANQKNGIRAIRKLVKASSVDLTILRDGVEIPISIPLE